MDTTYIHFCIASEAVHRIIHKELDIRKMCAMFVSRMPVTKKRIYALVITERYLHSVLLIVDFLNLCWLVTNAASSLTIQRLRHRVPNRSALDPQINKVHNKQIHREDQDRLRFRQQEHHLHPMCFLWSDSQWKVLSEDIEGV